jgi:hypothetical protein
MRMRWVKRSKYSGSWSPERAVYLELVEVLESFKVNNRASASSNRTLNPPR